MLHEVLSRQQLHFRRASKHRVSDRSAGPQGRIRQRRDAVLHRSHRHQRSSMERRGDSTDAVYTTPEPCTLIAARVQSHQPSPRQVGFAREPTVSIRQVVSKSRSRRKSHVSSKNTTAAQYRVQADGFHRESVEEGCGQNTQS